MVQLTRIYTRGGDKGKTALGNATRVSKNDVRIEAIGNVDECNAALGLVDCSRSAEMKKLIQRLQNDLFDVGADLCVPDEDSSQNKLKVTAKQVQDLENEIDTYNSRLKPLNSFVLPGGSQLSASLHFVRTVVRRAERSVCALNQSTLINPEVIKYLNRLSDLLFVLARVANNNGEDDILWVPGGQR